MYFIYGKNTKKMAADRYNPRGSETLYAARPGRQPRVNVANLRDGGFPVPDRARDLPGARQALPRAHVHTEGGLRVAGIRAGSASRDSRGWSALAAHKKVRGGFRALRRGGDTY